MPRSILQLQREAENLSDERLLQEAQNPQLIPSYLVAQELQRRKIDRQFQAEAVAAENVPETNVFAGLVNETRAAMGQQLTPETFGQVDPQMSVQAMAMMDPRQEQAARSMMEQDALSGIGSVPMPQFANLARGGIVPGYVRGGMTGVPNPDPEDEALMAAIRSAELDVQRAKDAFHEKRETGLRERNLPPEGRLAPLLNFRALFDEDVRAASQRLSDLRLAQREASGFEKMLQGESFLDEQPVLTNAPVVQPQVPQVQSQVPQVQPQVPQAPTDTIGLERQAVIEMGQGTPPPPAADQMSNNLQAALDAMAAVPQVTYSPPDQVQIDPINLQPIFSGVREQIQGLGDMTREERAVMNRRRQRVGEDREKIDPERNLRERQGFAISRAAQELLGQTPSGSLYEGLSSLRNQQRTRDELIEQRANAIEDSILSDTATRRRSANEKAVALDQMVAGLDAANQQTINLQDATMAQQRNIAEATGQLQADIANARSASDIAKAAMAMAEALGKVEGEDLSELIRFFQAAVGAAPHLQDRIKPTLASVVNLINRALGIRSQVSPSFDDPDA